MGNRLSKIATRTGDDGSTGLGDGSRIRKSALRVQAMGDIDETNSAIGVLLAEPIPHAMRLRLTRIQNHLFDLGGEICIPGHSALTPQHVLFLDEALAEENAALPPLKEFILPGGTRAASLCQLARAIWPPRGAPARGIGGRRDGVCAGPAICEPAVRLSGSSKRVNLTINELAALAKVIFHR